MKECQINEYYLDDGFPIKCWHCQSNDIRSDIKDILTHIISEQEYICNSCGSDLAYWAYGYFDPGYKKDFLDSFIG